jgi:rhomboid family GlyGly-CTERM serine protease
VWIATYGILFLIAVLALAGEPARALLRYERAGLMAGEAWRLVSGHLVHIDLAHAILNGAALWLLVAAVGRGMLAREWAFILAGSVAAVDAGLFWLVPEVGWYVGLSGVLHGALAGPALLLCLRRRPLGLLLLALLAAKLSWEVFYGAMPGTGALVSGPVITEAHLFGAIGGLAGALLSWVMARWRSV